MNQNPRMVRFSRERVQVDHSIILNCDNLEQLANQATSIQTLKEWWSTVKSSINIPKKITPSGPGKFGPSTIGTVASAH